MGYWSFWQKETQLRTIKNHDGETFPTRTIRQIFGLGISTNIRTTWLYTQGHLTRPSWGMWTVHLIPTRPKQYCEVSPWQNIH